MKIDTTDKQKTNYNSPTSETSSVSFGNTWDCDSCSSPTATALEDFCTQRSSSFCCSGRSDTVFVQEVEALKDIAVCQTQSAANTSATFVEPAFFSEFGVEQLERCGLEMVDAVEEGLKMEFNPLETQEGVTGAFYMRNEKGNYAAIFKPEDEGLSRRSSEASASRIFRRGVKYDETSVREVAAYLLDHGSFAKVPQTLMVKVQSTVFNQLIPSTTVNHIHSSSFQPLRRCNSLKHEAEDLMISSRRLWKIGSLQKYIPHDCDACDISYAKFSVDDVQRLGAFDVRVLNTDRHEGNILISLSEPGNFRGPAELTPIDHGLILPDFEEINTKGNFCWMLWPQAKEKFSDEVKEYVSNLDAKKDHKMLIRLLGNKLTLRGLFSLLIGTALLKICVLEFDLSLFDIGEIITGNFNDFFLEEEKPTPLIQIIRTAQEETECYDPVGQTEQFQETFSSLLREYLNNNKQFTSSSM